MPTARKGWAAIGFAKVSTVSLLASVSMTVWATPSWQFTPHVDAQVTATSNMDLEDQNPIATTITELGAGLSGVRRGAEASAGFDYRATAIEYGAKRGDDRVKQRLAATAKLDFFSGLGSVVTNANYDEQLNDRRASTLGNSRNNSTVFNETFTFRVAPQLTARTPFADLTAKTEFNRVDSKGDRATNGLTYSLDLSTHDRGHRASWNLTATQSRADLGEANEQQEDAIKAALNFQLSSQFIPRITAGYVDNHLDGTSSRSAEAGSFLGAGFNWRPNPRSTVDLSYNSRVQRSSAWGLTFNHRGKRSLFTWVIEESLSSSRQELLSSARVGSFICPVGSTDISTCRFVTGDRPSSVLPDEEVFDVAVPVTVSSTGDFIQRSNRINLSTTRGKSLYNLTLSSLNREFQLNGATEEEIALTANWRYRLGRRTTLSTLLSSSVLQTDDESELKDVDLQLTLSHNTTRSTSLFATLRNHQRQSDVDSERYQESAFVAGISSRF